ncbi:unnamed protein product, partial [Heterosigma akashiwo]
EAAGAAGCLLGPHPLHRRAVQVRAGPRADRTPLRGGAVRGPGRPRRGAAGERGAAAHHRRRAARARRQQRQLPPRREGLRQGGAPAV